MNDGLPPHICSQCILNVSRAYTFKQQAETSEATLRQYISNYNNPQEALPNILEMGYDIENMPLPTQDTADDVMSNDSKSSFFMMNDNTPDPLDSHNLPVQMNNKLVKIEVSLPKYIICYSFY